MRFTPAHHTGKAKPGIINGLKLASHVSMSCATAFHYTTSGLTPNDGSGSRSVENVHEIVSIDDPPESTAYLKIPAAMGRGSRRRDLMSNRAYAVSSGFLPENSQPMLPPALFKSSSQTTGKDCLNLTVADLRMLWPGAKARQVSITQIEWYDNASAGGNFLLLRLSSTTPRVPQWLRLERRFQDLSLKGAAALLRPLGRFLVDDSVVLSSNFDALVTPEECHRTPRETFSNSTPLTFVLDVLDAVRENCPTHSIGSMTGDRLFLSIIMDAVHQFYAPSDVSDNKMIAQPNNPCRILEPLNHRKACSKIAQEVEIRSEWELV